jgi:hypothetical protein
VRTSAPVLLAACIVAVVGAPSAQSVPAAPSAGPGYVVAFEFAYDSPPFPDTRYRVTVEVTGEVCGDPLASPWDFVGQRSGGPNTTPPTTSTVTFASANPATITGDRWSDEGGAEVARIDFLLRMTPGTPPVLKAEWETTGDIENVVATPAQTTATAQRLPLCSPASPPPPPVAAGTPTGSPAAGYAAGRVKLPGQRRFSRITRDQPLPFGTQIDVSNGRGVRMTDGGRGRLTISGQRGGVLGIVTLARVAGLVELRLTGGNLGQCGNAVRRVWANGEGKFRVRGRYAAVTRGGWWLTSDFCDRTVVQARRGSLLVDDLAAKRKVVVRAPKTYIARPGT